MKITTTAKGNDYIVQNILKGIGKGVLVGIPKDASRKEDESEDGERISNATLGYIHEFGSPARHIPPRGFLLPGIKKQKEAISHALGVALKRKLARDNAGFEKGLDAAGLVAVRAVQKMFTENDWPALSAAGIESRKRRRKSRSNAVITPLVDTGQLRRSITYVKE